MNQQFNNISRIISESLSPHLKDKLIKLSVNLATKGTKKEIKKLKNRRQIKKNKEEADRIFKYLKNNLDN
jgi:hypothetical protein